MKIPLLPCTNATTLAMQTVQIPSTSLDVGAELQVTNEEKYSNQGSVTAAVLRTRHAAQFLSNNCFSSAPIDIHKELNAIIKYRDTLKSLLNTNTSPHELFFQHNEKFIPHIITVENVRAAENAWKLKNPALQLHLRYFTTLTDFFVYMMAHVPQLNKECTSPLKAVVDLGDYLLQHKIYCEVLFNKQRISVVAVDSSNAARMQEVKDSLDPNVSGVVECFKEASAEFNLSSYLSMTVLALHIQKSNAGCPTFALDTAIKIHHRRESLRCLHDRNFSREAAFELIDDPKGNILDWSVYVHAQSKKQIESIIANPKYQQLDLANAPMPNHACGESLLGHHLKHRVTQHGYNQKTDEEEDFTFCNSIDIKRIKYLDRVITYLQKLNAVKKNEAGQIFANQIAVSAPCMRKEPEGENVG